MSVVFVYPGLSLEMKKYNVLHRRNYGRLGIFLKFAIWPFNYLLHVKAKQFIFEKRKQLVIFSFDHIGLTINLHGIYERKELENVFEWMNKCKVEMRNGCAIDIGANIGNHSLFFSDYFEKVYCFEPNRKVFRVLSLNAELAKNITCFNIGISDANSQSYLQLNQNNLGGSSVTDSPSNENQSIELKTLDSMCGNIERIRLIKIDVEGYEYPALIGAENTIRMHMPIILFEQNISDFVDGQSKVVSLLKSFGYAKFATLRTYPTLSQSKNIFVKFLHSLFVRGLVGESLQIRIENEIYPDFYPFLIAIPAWLNTTG